MDQNELKRQLLNNLERRRKEREAIERGEKSDTVAVPCSQFSCGYTREKVGTQPE